MALVVTSTCDIGISFVMLDVSVVELILSLVKENTLGYVVFIDVGGIPWLDCMCACCKNGSLCVDIPTTV